MGSHQPLKADECQTDCPRRFTAFDACVQPQKDIIGKLNTRYLPAAAKRNV